MMIFELLSQETNMNMWQEGSILPVRINQPNLVSPSPPISNSRCPLTKFKSEQTRKASRWSTAHVPSLLKATSIFSGWRCSKRTTVAHSSLNKSDHNDLSSRIKAVNKSSKGHWNYSIPSEPSDSMIAKIRYSEKSSTACFTLPPI